MGLLRHSVEHAYTTLRVAGNADVGSIYLPVKYAVWIVILLREISKRCIGGIPRAGAWILVPNNDEAPRSKVLEQYRIFGRIDASAVDHYHHRIGLVCCFHRSGIVCNKLSPVLRGIRFCVLDLVFSHCQIFCFQLAAGLHGFRVVAGHKGLLGQNEQQDRQQQNNGENYNTHPFQDFQNNFHVIHPYTSLNILPQFSYTRHKPDCRSASRGRNAPSQSTDSLHRFPVGRIPDV